MTYITYVVAFIFDDLSSQPAFTFLKSTMKILILVLHNKAKRSSAKRYNLCQNNVENFTKSSRIVFMGGLAYGFLKEKNS